MALAIDEMHGRGPSNEMHPQLQPKNVKVRLAAKGVFVLFITKKMVHGLCGPYDTWAWLK